MYLQPTWKRADLTSSPANGSAEARCRTSAYLHPGQVITSAEPCEITTILGSCVSVCLWDPSLRTGGVNHYLLPWGHRHDESSNRFGNYAIARLMQEMIDRGSIKSNLQAKVFGGAYIFAGFKRFADHLGANNSAVALQILEEEGVPVVNLDIDGPKGRKLRFHTDTGDAWIRLI